MASCFEVYGYVCCAHCRCPVDIPFRLLHHQVTVQRNVRKLLYRLHEGKVQSKIGNELTIHNIDVQVVYSRGV